ncbi:sugar transferase [Vibrio harveyi]|uniref:sugar transferase n=1 Tax=Vibrio TaxID=662 RepID=UPI000543D464|nr:MULTISPECIES: sugar transferase [Vibrio]EGR2894835.1 sugar transferase [Vibrio parahaemolyticus]EGR2931881.1 sugar transferase [Vibrio parahaemolyticus]EGR2955759.1 sugar transferase [Vibrio parahaemolyticus]EGR2960187.1 sugar transferase [Vibrio parahaemolyticus]EHH1104145.1 sugar transferase [Vibrio parahaemolyticus]
MTDSISNTLQKREPSELSQNNLESKTPVQRKLTGSASTNCIYIYCPIADEEKISSILDRHPEIIAQVNNYTLRDFKNKTLCHFKSSHLETELQAYLVAATELGAWVEPLVSYLDRRLGYTETELLHSGYFLHQKAFSILSNRKNSREKRAIDLLFVFMLAWVAIPIGLITALLIKLESPGPIFFKQRRTGQYNEEFDVIKFRSMRNDAEKDGAKWATKNDARVTRIGKFIRKTRIDELPQLINVLRNEMSMVGPRPEREVFIAELEKEIPYYRFRHAVKPGVTGLAQVKYPYGASVEDAVWKHKYDVYYIKHQNWKIEVKILILTIKTVLFGMGR